MSELTTNFNYLQPNNFQVSIERKRFGNLTFFAQTVNHPGLTVTAPALAVPRLANVAVAGDTVNIDELSMDIILDEDMNTYTEMYDWLNYSVQKNYTTPRNRKEEDVYIPEADITLNILSSHNNKVKQIKYIDCVPTSLGVLTLQSTLTDTQPLTFPITFRTSYFEII